MRVRDVLRVSEAELAAAEDRVELKHAAPRLDQPRDRS